MSTDKDGPRRVLPNVSVHPEFLGRTYIEWGKMALPTVLGLYFSVYVLPGALQPLGFVGTGVIALTSLIAILGSPGHMTAGEFVEKRINHLIRQPVMLHDRNPEESNIEQPENESTLRSILNEVPLRTFPFNKTPVDPDVAEGNQRAQEIVPAKRAYRGEYAIECEDGSFIGAIRVTPANMSTADGAKWRQQVNQLASIITSAVDYDAQLDEIMRAVDYRDRLETYRKRTSDLRQRALELDEAGVEAGEVQSAYSLGGESVLATETLADITEERAAVVNIYNETTLVREHYVIVRVNALDAAKTTSDDRGGIESVPILGDIVSERRLQKQLESEEHTDTMLDLLRQRMDSLANKLTTLDDIKATPLSSVNYAQVIADYYRTANVYANDDFNSLVRESPLPGEYEDPEHDVEHEYARGTGAASRGGWSQPTMSADGGSQTIGGEEQTSGRIRQLVEDSPVPILSDEQRDERFKSLLTPESVDAASDPGHITINGDVHTATLWIDEWPEVPSDGMLKEIFAYGKPGVDVTISTHLTGLDKSSAKRDMRNKVNSLKAKWKDAESKDHITASRKKREYQTAKEIDEALAESDHGLFEAGCYITVRAEDESDLNEAISAIKSRLSEAPAHARGVRADYNHLAGFRSTAPVAQDHLDRRVKMRGDGLASIFPYASHNLVESGGIEVGTHEERNEPTILDLFGRDTGYNFGIFGNIGSGKTTTMSELLLRLKLKNPEIDVAVIDPLQEFAGLCKLFDGDRIIIGGDTAINPFHIEPTPEAKLDEIGRTTPYKDAIRRGVEFIETYYRLENRDLGKKRGVWERAIKEAYAEAGITEDPATHANESPVLPDIIGIIKEMVRSPEEYVFEDLADDEGMTDDRKQKAIDILNNDLEPFSDGGKYEHLTRPTEIDFEDTGMVYLDLQRYENDSDSGLMMQLLVSQIYEQAKISANPSVLAIDESHYMLKQNSEMEFLKQAVRHSRHYDLSLGFSTQSISEFFAENSEGETQLTDSAEVIINNLSVQFLHFLKEMNEDWAGELGLTGPEMNYVKEADPGNEERGYSQALLKVNQKGCFPLKVEMSEDMNPREFALLRYDQSKHPNDLAEYLRRFDESCAWSWAESGYAAKRAGASGDGSESTVEAVTSPSSHDGSGGAQNATESRETDADKSRRDEQLTVIKGVGETRAAALHRVGIDSVGDVIDADTEDLEQARGIGQERAERLQEAAEVFMWEGASVLDPGQPLREIGTLNAEKANALREAGYETVRDVVDADPDAIAMLDPFDATSARFIQSRAEQADQTGQQAATDGGRR